VVRRKLLLLLGAGNWWTHNRMVNLKIYYTFLTSCLHRIYNRLGVIILGIVAAVLSFSLFGLIDACSDAERGCIGLLNFDIS
jgi:hypothetical protein